MTKTKIKCIAIDDEPIALDIISDYIKKIPFLELLTTFRNGLQAIEFLQNNTVDLIFLDINMPEINGIEFFKSLNKKPKVIFTTAYSEFAVESYDLNAVDYLLKPFAFERFLKAINKIQTYQDENNNPSKDNSIILILLKILLIVNCFYKQHNSIVKSPCYQQFFIISVIGDNRK